MQSVNTKRTTDVAANEFICYAKSHIHTDT